MLQIIDRQTTRSGAVKAGRLADPDLLLEIAERVRDNPTAATLDRLMKLFSLILHDIRMGGVWKRTNSGRLIQTEKMLVKYIAPEYRERSDVLDLGASDGTTTVELLHALRSAWGGEVLVWLTDRNLFLDRYRIAGVVEYRSADGEPIMVRIGRIGLRLARRRYGAEEDGDPLARSYLGLKRLRRGMVWDARISLVNPLAVREPGVIVRELNCLKRSNDLIGKFAAVRASNILNISYFSRDVLTQAIAHIHAYLREGGCLVISRNADHSSTEVERGSVWLRRGNRLERVDDFGGGSEISSLVDTWADK